MKKNKFKIGKTTFIKFTSRKEILEYELKNIEKQRVIATFVILLCSIIVYYCLIFILQKINYFNFICFILTSCTTVLVCNIYYSYMEELNADLSRRKNIILEHYDRFSKKDIEDLKGGK